MYKTCGNTTNLATHLNTKHQFAYLKFVLKQSEKITIYTLLKLSIYWFYSIIIDTGYKYRFYIYRCFSPAHSYLCAIYCEYTWLVYKLARSKLGMSNWKNISINIESIFLICCIKWFTSLCKNLFNLLEFLAEAFRCHVHHFQCLTVPLLWIQHFNFLDKINLVVVLSILILHYNMLC